MTPNAFGRRQASSDRGTVWLEVALNGGWTRNLQPLIPISVREIVEQGVACVSAGAAIVHVHAYDEAGLPTDDADVYSAIIEGIRSKVDAIVYPTIAFEGDDRYAAIEPLARRGLLEWASLDPGSVNLNRFADIREGRSGTVYVNNEQTVRRGLQMAADLAFLPSFACYEPGFIRMGAAMHHEFPDLPHPVYRLMFSSEMAFGFPPEPFALEAYQTLLEKTAPGAPAMIAGLQVDLSPIVRSAIDAGMHLRVGLEDALLGCEIGNVELVERTVAKLDCLLATAAEIRAATKGTSRRGGQT